MHSFEHAGLLLTRILATPLIGHQLLSGVSSAPPQLPSIEELDLLATDPPAEWLDDKAWDDYGSR